MKILRLFLRMPIGIAGLLLTALGLIYLPFSGLGFLIALWIACCGILFLLLTRPLIGLRYSLLWQFLVMSICPGAMAGYIWVNDYFYTDSFVYLIPESYRGALTIKYRLADGDPVVREGRKIRFAFDETGLLHSQYMGGKVIDHLQTKYYFVSPSGERTPIPYGYPLDSSQVVIQQKALFYHGDTGIWVLWVGLPYVK